MTGCITCCRTTFGFEAQNLKYNTLSEQGA